MKIIYYLSLILLLCSSCSNEESVQFAICADVHHDIIHNAPERISTFIERAKMNNADFIIQLGDFCFPEDENTDFLDVWNNFPGKKYHVLGNHDMDNCSKQEIMDYIDMKAPYYSFQIGDSFKFIVLDPNFYKESNDSLASYDHGNYHSHSESRAYVPQKQISWLRDELYNTDRLVMIFTHQNLEGSFGVNNQEEIRKVLEDANRDKKKVIACFSGHDHYDLHKEIKGIHYIRINSMSYAWVGEKFQCEERFSDSINSYRPSLKYTLPYDTPLSAFVKINSKGTITVEGMPGKFITPGPDELKVDVGYPVTSNITDRKLSF